MGLSTSIEWSLCGVSIESGYTRSSGYLFCSSKLCRFLRALDHEIITYYDGVQKNRYSPHAMLLVSPFCCLPSRFGDVYLRTLLFSHDNSQDCVPSLAVRLLRKSTASSWTWDCRGSFPSHISPRQNSQISNPLLHNITVSFSLVAEFCRLFCEVTGRWELVSRQNPARVWAFASFIHAPFKTIRLTSSPHWFMQALTSVQGSWKILVEKATEAAYFSASRHEVLSSHFSCKRNAQASQDCMYTSCVMSKRNTTDRPAHFFHQTVLMAAA